MVIWKSLYYWVFISLFSSPEPKFLITCRLWYIPLSVNFSHFFSSRTTGLNLTKLGSNHSYGKTIQNFKIKEKNFFFSSKVKGFWSAPILKLSLQSSKYELFQKLHRRQIYCQYVALSKNSQFITKTNI